jgi:hypothetical protein
MANDTAVERGHPSANICIVVVASSVLLLRMDAE